MRGAAETKLREKRAAGLREDNTCEKLFEALGEDNIARIARDFIDFFESFPAVCRENGVCALGIFASDWCMLLNQEHFPNTENWKLLESGKWLGHESCRSAAKRVMETGQEIETQCQGGVHLDIVPVRTADGIVGSISFGYAELSQMSDNVAYTEQEPGTQFSQPRFFIDMAKRKLKIAAQFMGSLVEQKQRQKESQENHERFRKNEERYRNLFTKNRAVTLLINLKTAEILDANPAAADFYGYSLDELRQMKITDLSVKGEGELRELMRKVESEEQLDFLLQHKLQSGEIRDVAVYSTPLSFHNEIVSYSIIHDVTDQIKAERELRESEERFRAIFTGATDFIYIKDLQRRFTSVNPAFESLVGRKSSEILGKRAEDILGREVSELMEQSELLVLKGESLENEVSVRVNGSAMIVNCSMEPLRDADGKIKGIFAIARDVTGRRQGEAQTYETQEYPSGAMQSMLRMARMAAKKTSTVLLLGESGSGKDHLARYIHKNSDRAGGPYLLVNCAAIPPQLAESELFGYEKGAFTGAHARRRGLLELAEGGTLLLNEIGELSLPLQAKLLTFLDTKRFTRVGGEEVISVNPRLIASTNKYLEKEVEAGRFREDLFYRLNVVSITLPPLRERLEDIPVLVEELLSKIQTQLRIREKPIVDHDSLKRLRAYSWPGNVRELRNVLERAVILSDEKTIRINSLDLQRVHQSLSRNHRPDTMSLNGTLQESINNLIRTKCIDALISAMGNKKIAAISLGIARSSLYHYIQALGITEKDYT